MAIARIMLAVLAAAVAGSVQGQQVAEYTETEAGPDKLPLGYPVPQPVESLTPVDGFRGYDSLHARHQALALEHDFIAAHKVGATIRGADIFAYALSDPDAVTPFGQAEPAFQITGGVHAREWQSPEAVTGIMERFAERRHDGGLYEYLVENTNLVVIPVLNIDGFRQTQRFPSRVILGKDPGDPDDNPRDGRMRRKNMRGVDTRLMTFDDHLGGIDLNRNNPPYAPSTRASGNPDSLIYHGGGAQTEPETKALADAAGLGPADRLRLYTDFHSFSQAFFDPLTGNQRQDAIQGRLINLARANLADQGTPYTRDPMPTEFSGIGSTDEFFAHIHQVPAWTLEIEPRFNAGGTQYGGFGATHDGFILPDSQVARMREELANAYALLFYAQAGPPAVSEARVLDASGNIVWAGEWHRTGQGTREFVISTDAPLVVGGKFRLWLAFDKPMRHRDEQGGIVNYPGTNGDIHPVIRFDGGTQEIAVIAGQGQWLDEPDAPGTPGYVHYRDDAYVAPFEIPATLEPGENETLTINIEAEDIARFALDADPATIVDWQGGHWIGYESADGSAGDTGGVDSTLEIGLVKQQPVQVAFSADRERVVEGGHVNVFLERQSTDTEFAINITATRFLTGPAPEEEALFETTVNFQSGGESIRSFRFTMPDDLEVLADTASSGVRLKASVEEGNAIVDQPDELKVTAEDNDRRGRRIVSVLDAHTHPLPPDVSPLPPDLALGARLSDTLLEAQSIDKPITVNLAGGAVYALDRPFDGETGFPAIRGDVTLAGRGSVLARYESSALAVPNFRLLHVLPEGRLRLEGVTLERGGSVGHQAGGAVLNEGEMHVERAVFRGNSANRAGAIANLGSAELTRTSLIDNSAAAGAGAIFNAGQLMLAGVTLSGNTTEGRGGAVFNQGELAVRESTFTGNTGNPGADLFDAGASVVTTSALASDGSCAGASGATDSGGFNLDASGTCGLLDGSDLVPAEPALGPLDNSGVHPPLASSPLVDVFSPSGPGCLHRDARGVPRPFAMNGEALCDIGAAERGLSVHRGLWFNPERSGHGIDLQQARDTLIVTWFTYLADGTPVWYQASAPFSGPAWQADLLRFAFDAESGTATGEVVGSVGLEFQSSTSATFEWDLSPIGAGSGSEPFEPLISDEAAPAFDTTGIWAAADGSGWGLTVDSQGDVHISTVYYYDAAGKPRWAQGAGRGGLDSLMPLNSFTGFCPGCSLQAMPVSSAPVGVQEVRFLSRQRGRIETDFSYPGSEGGAWRQKVELGPLSDPVP